MTEFISKSENDTIDFAYNFAKNLNKNSILILCGDLGSGKTKFTQGILKYFKLIHVEKAYSSISTTESGI